MVDAPHGQLPPKSSGDSQLTGSGTGSNNDASTISDVFLPRNSINLHDAVGSGNANANGAAFMYES